MIIGGANSSALPPALPAPPARPTLGRLATPPSDSPLQPTKPGCFADQNEDLLVICYVAIEKAIEIVDLPIKHGYFPSFTRGYHLVTT